MSASGSTTGVEGGGVFATLTGKRAPLTDAALLIATALRRPLGMIRVLTSDPLARADPVFQGCDAIAPDRNHRPRT